MKLEEHARKADRKAELMLICNDTSRRPRYEQEFKSRNVMKLQVRITGEQAQFYRS